MKLSDGACVVNVVNDYRVVMLTASARNVALLDPMAPLIKLKSASVDILLGLRKVLVAMLLNRSVVAGPPIAYWRRRLQEPWCRWSPRMLGLNRAPGGVVAQRVRGGSRLARTGYDGYGHGPQVRPRLQYGLTLMNEVIILDDLELDLVALRLAPLARAPGG